MGGDLGSGREGPLGVGYQDCGAGNGMSGAVKANIETTTSATTGEPMQENPVGVEAVETAVAGGRQV